jgi:peptidoglycan/xylan/chitin deacetylase (PgdA/CDA1 family)
LLKLLERHRVSAAFFCIGQKVHQYPEIVQHMANRGYLIANHTYHHHWWTNFLCGKALQKEINRCQRAIETATGAPPRLFRPPMGLTNPHLSSVLKRNSLLCVGWDVRSYDLHGSVQCIFDRIIGKVRNGSIILLHDGGNEPEKLVFLVDKLIMELRLKGFSLGNLNDMLGHSILPREDAIDDRSHVNSAPGSEC